MKKQCDKRKQQKYKECYLMLLERALINENINWKLFEKFIESKQKCFNWIDMTRAWHTHTHMGRCSPTVALHGIDRCSLEFGYIMSVCTPTPCNFSCVYACISVLYVFRDNIAHIATVLTFPPLQLYDWFSTPF